MDTATPCRDFQALSSKVGATLLVASGQRAADAHAMLAKEGDHLVVQGVGRGQRLPAVVELAEADLRVDVGRSLLIEVAHSLQGAKARGMAIVHDLDGDGLIFLPTDWEPIENTVAWVAFGQAFWPPAHTGLSYPGLEEWLSPDDAMFLLGLAREAAGTGSALHLPPWIQSYALRRPGRRGDRETDSDPAKRMKQGITAAMRQLERAIESPEGAARRTHATVMHAVDQIQDALASGNLSVFGWPGAEIPSPVTEPRRRLPSELFASPVSLSPDGLLPIVAGDLRRKEDVIYCGLLFPAADILRIWPVTEGPPAQSAGPGLVQPQQRGVRGQGERRAGGRPPIHDWARFRAELVRIMALDGGSIGRAELKTVMKDWAAEHMPTEPDDRTVEKQVDELIVLVRQSGAMPD